MNNFKTIDELMENLEAEHGIKSDEADKEWFKNNGYYHSFKGYRFYNKKSNKIKITNTKELIEIVNFDNSLKKLLYDKVMYIETVIKNVALCEIMESVNNSSLKIIEVCAIDSYIAATKRGLDKKSAEGIQRKKVGLQQRIYSVINNKYCNGNPIICNYVNKKEEDIPIWAIFEVLTLGEFGYFISLLKENIKLNISKCLKLNIGNNRTGLLLQRYIYLLKDLRNAVAHNGVIYDGRFTAAKIDNSVSSSIEIDTKIKNINFDFFIDYVIFIILLLSKIGVGKNELSKFLAEYEENTEKLYNNLSFSEYTRIIGTANRPKIQGLKQFIKNLP